MGGKPVPGAPDLWIPACAGMHASGAPGDQGTAGGDRFTNGQDSPPGFLRAQECMPLAPRATRGRRGGAQGNDGLWVK